MDHFCGANREYLILQTTLFQRQVTLEKNMFPYATPRSVEHWTLWCREEMSHEEVCKYVNTWLCEHMPHVYRWNYDDNSGDRSIDLFHVHVYIETIPQTERTSTHHHHHHPQPSLSPPSSPSPSLPGLLDQSSDIVTSYRRSHSQSHSHNHSMIYSDNNVNCDDDADDDNDVGVGNSDGDGDGLNPAHFIAVCNVSMTDTSSSSDSSDCGSSNCGGSDGDWDVLR